MDALCLTASPPVGMWGMCVLGGVAFHVVRCVQLLGSALQDKLGRLATFGTPSAGLSQWGLDHDWRLRTGSGTCNGRKASPGVGSPRGNESKAGGEAGVVSLGC
uniref:Uncharacterized protein n=1 Tax=Eutreptiella gymnastica TaxID=73025 RepID=A0A7S4G8K2_9EUGL